MLVQIRVGDFPWKKEEARSRDYNDLNKRAFPETIKEERAITTSDLARLINRG